MAKPRKFRRVAKVSTDGGDRYC